jgi:hypothetical protein
MGKKRKKKKNIHLNNNGGTTTAKIILQYCPVQATDEPETRLGVTGFRTNAPIHPPLPGGGEEG